MDELLPRLLSGDPHAFQELVKSLQGGMRAVAWAIAGPAHADDIVQDAWLATVRNLTSFQHRSSLKTWILTITANTAKNRLRQIRREASLVERSEPSATLDDARFAADGSWSQTPAAWHNDNPEALFAAEELRMCLERTLSNLPKQQSSVLLLRERAGMELTEIGTLLELSPSNVRVLLHRARLKVFASVERFEQTGQY